MAHKFILWKYFKYLYFEISFLSQIVKPTFGTNRMLKLLHQENISITQSYFLGELLEKKYLTGLINCELGLEQR